MVGILRIAPGQIVTAVGGVPFRKRPYETCTQMHAGFICESRALVLVFLPIPNSS